VPEFRSERTAPWLELELARQLSPVSAPESLWDRIEQPRVPRRQSRFHRALWPVAAMAALMVSSLAAWRVGIARNPAADIEKLAGQELLGLTGNPRRLDFRSEDPRQIRNWVKANADIDLDLPADRLLSGSSDVRLLGARLIERRGTRIAAIAYRVRDGAAALLVSRGRSTAEANSATPTHRFARLESAGNAWLVSWSMREQVYALASSVANDPQAACLLCHANPPGQTALN
jgi:hypothetical protein